MMGCEFVCSTISASNLGNINVELVSKDIEGGLKEIIICADNDDVGLTHAEEAAEKYKSLGIEVSVLYPNDDGDDFNDVLVKQLRLQCKE